MSRDHVRPLSRTEAKPALDMNDIEMVFGTPAPSKNGTVYPATHVVDNETKHARDDLSRHHNNIVGNEAAAQPLLEPKLPKQDPPLAGPEIDDLDDEHAVNHGPYPGIDDGLLEPKVHNASTPELLDHDDSDKEIGSKDHTPEKSDGSGVNEDGKWDAAQNGLDVTDFYYPGDGYGGNDLHNRFGEDRPGSPLPTIPGSIPDVNTYQQKKNLAQGMMDLALLSANANQLRYVLESQSSHPYYYPSLTLIGLSIVFQIFVGVGLIMNSRYNVKNEKDICKADKINNMTVLGIFMITIVNVFVTSFSVASPSGLPAQSAGSG